jgi:hypothetical protein
MLLKILPFALYTVPLSDFCHIDFRYIATPCCLAMARFFDYVAGCLLFHCLTTAKSLIRLFCRVITWYVKMSRAHSAVYILLLKYNVTSSVGLIYRSIVLWQSRKPNWLTLSRPVSSMCLWTIFRTTSSNSLLLVDKRLIGGKLWGHFGFLLVFSNIINFASFQGIGKWDSRRQWLNKCVNSSSGRFGRCLRHSFGILSTFSISINLLIYVCHKVLLFLAGCHLQMQAELGFWFPSFVHAVRHTDHVMCWFPKQCAIMLAFSSVWYITPKGPWRAIGAFDPSLFISAFAIGHRAWGVTSHFPTFISHRSSVFMGVIRLMVLATKLTATF